MHIFSMTCKAESALDRLGDPKERKRAIQWFRDHFISKLYIESYRHGRIVSRERLIEIRDDFAAAGFEVGGCITPTNLNRDGSDALVSCYTDPSAQEKLKHIVELTASIFDFFILDDFLFTDCTCDRCRQLQGNRDVIQARCETMLHVSREYIIKPAKAVNPDVQIIIKYPLWYELFTQRGYDAIRETEIYDQVWIGTETREPDSPEAGRRPQTSASWIQGWINDIDGKKSGGGWFDPIDTAPATYLEQARQTIIGKARESLLHCYDYLGTDTPGIAVHGKDLQVTHGQADAEAFRTEAQSLQKLADILEPMESYGTLVPKNPDAPPTEHGEKYLPGFIGMLGIAVQPSASLKQCGSAVLSMQSEGFDDLEDFIASACETGKPLLITKALCESLRQSNKRLPDSVKEIIKNEISAVSDQPQLIHCGNNLSVLTIPKDLWQLTAMPPEMLNSLRNRLLAPFGMELFAPGKVSLHLFRNGKQYCEIIENFNDFSVDVRLHFSDSQAAARKQLLALPDEQSATAQNDESGTYDISLAPRSLLVLSTDDVQ